MRIHHHRLLASAALGALCAIAAPALAETAEPQTGGKDADIVVTAQKRETKLQDTPIAVSVVSGEQIAAEARTKLDDALVNAPGVNVQGVSRGFMVSIRGLGLNLPPQNGAGAVATNFDGTYNSRGEAASTGFYDLERIETLSGPQSTIYGRNAVGGVVNVISRNPELGVLGGYVQGEVGNYSNFRGEGALNLPLADSVALRVAAAGVTRDGYLSNGRDDNKASSLRAKLLVDPGAGLSLLLGYEQTTLGGKGPGAIPDSSFVAGTHYTTDPSDGYQHHVARKYWAEVKADIGPGELVLQPSYQTLKGIVQGSFGGNFAYNYDPLYTNQFAFEARYGSKAEAKVQWDVGYYHYHNNGTGPLPISGACYAYSATPVAGANQVYIPAPGFSNAPAGPPGTPCVTTAYATDFGVDARSTNVDSVFGQATLPLGERARLTLGGRESWVTTGGSSDLNSNNTNGATGTPLTTPNVVQLATVKTSYFDYKATLEADLSENTLVYATVASGHREGGYSFQSATAAPSPYAPESMVDYEVGIKNTLLDGALLLNADVFYYDYKSYQLVYFNPAAGIFSPQFNTYPGREIGAEAYAAFALTAADKFTASLVYLDSELKGTSAYAGAPFTNSPKWAFKAGYAHEFELGDAGTLTARGDFRALSQQLVYPTFAADITPSASTVMPGYATGDLFLSWASANRRYSLTGYVKNVNDKLIKSSEFFGYGQVQAPRTYGVTASVKF